MIFRMDVIMTTNYKDKLIISKRLILIVVLVLTQYQQTIGQQRTENPMSQYFHNRSLLNPGFTGTDGNKIQAFQNRSWVGFDGAPVLTVLTGEFNFGKNAAIGGHIFSDKSGIVYRTTGLLNYSYRIKFKNEHELRLGIGFSVTSERLDLDMLEPGASVDPLIAANINGKPAYDGNFGMLYNAKQLSIWSSFFRISENLSNKSNLGNADLLMMKSGIYYHINQDKVDQIQFKPLAMISLYKDFAPVFDFGTQIIVNKYVNAMFVYQTIGNVRAGAGLTLGDICEANIFYNSNNRQANMNAQQFEFGLTFKLSKN